MLILNSFSAFLNTTSTMVSFLPSSDSRSAICTHDNERETRKQLKSRSDEKEEGGERKRPLLDIDCVTVTLAQ